jgi:SAM-dependent methyltransferase
MQTEAEKYLIFILKKLLSNFKGVKAKLINLGAAKSTVVEDDVVQSNSNFICDRVDVDDCRVSKGFVGNCYISPLENMKEIQADTYDIAFANFVFEHVQDVKKASQEIARICKKGAYLVLSLSNPKALEFRLAKITPTKFHQLFRKKDHPEAYDVEYAYKNINEISEIFSKNGWELEGERFFPATYSYLHRFPVINLFSLVYDKLISFFKVNSLLGHTVLVLKLEDKK